MRAGDVVARDKYAVRLAQEQREELQRLIRVGKNSARVTARARILLKSDDGWAAPQVAEALNVALSTVYRVKQRFAEEGLERVLQDRPQANRPRKLDDRGEAHLIALACSPPPEGHDHWTLRLLAGKVVELGLTPSMSHEGVRQRLKKRPQAVAEEGVVHSQGWIGIDITHLAVALMKNRLKTMFNLEPGRDYDVLGEPERRWERPGFGGAGSLPIPVLGRVTTGGAAPEGRAKEGRGPGY